MNTSTVDVAVIGAGIAGLTCAQHLQQAGYRVIVLEKSRGVGGRMATRRVEGTPVDHGVRSLQPQGEFVQGLIEQLKGSDRPENQLQLWTDTFYNFTANQLQCQPFSQPYYVMPSGMNGVGKVLATGLEIGLSRRVESLKITESKIWELQLEITDSSATENPPTLTAKILVIAIPAPQALMLLESEQIVVDSHLLEQVRSVEYDPCITVMAGYPSEKNSELPPWKAVNFPDDEELAWVGIDSSKRLNSSQPVVVIQSSPQFAQQYLEATNLNPVAERLIQTTATKLLPGFTTPEWMQVHRWRYAFCRKFLSVSCLPSTQPLPFVCAGDWCGGNQIEGALKSGVVAADWVKNFTHL